jgi:(1->4)-alpha-D-glucan 1-alpha-D-glucosylmutase
MELSDLIDRLAARFGIEGHWYDYRGERHEVSLESKAALLQAMGIATHDSATLERCLFEAELAEWYRVLPPVAVLREQREGGIPIAVRAEHTGFAVDWRILTEEGPVLSGTLRPQDLPWLEEAHVEGVLHKRFAFRPDVHVPLGYHRLELLSSGASAPFARCHLIVVPERCYQPEILASGQKIWGIAVQLYTLRSDVNWGIGDFGDLGEFATQAAEFGAEFVALNPLHALFSSNPAHASPYSPSSRGFLNTLYIDVPSVEDFGECEEAEELTETGRFRQRLETLRAQAHVDYVGVAELKREVLELLYRHFCERHLAVRSERAEDFARFCEAGGEALTRQACFDTLYEILWREQGRSGWREWPEEYRDPDAVAVDIFADANQDRVRYYRYLQWIAARQLEHAADCARKAGMRIGLYLDLAVGVDPSGAEAWLNQDVLSDSASVGAPPDPLALTGQDWGVPPLKPEELRQQGYRAFAALMRENMKNAGALRIDHVMALYRLWWVPRGMPSSAGAYVQYRPEDLFGIVALESQRNQCLVIGEDLGTVPDAIRLAMPDFGLYSYRVLYFEKDEEGVCVRPEDYPREALVTVSTHDLPPFKSFWTGSDLELRERLGLYPDDKIRKQTFVDRVADRRMLLRALVEAGEWQAGAAEELPPYSPELAEAVERYIAQSRAALMSVQLEDWLGMEDPVNVPGTSGEHPNWQRKLETAFVDILADPRIWLHAANINAKRRS